MNLGEECVKRSLKSRGLAVVKDGKWTLTDDGKLTFYRELIEEEASRRKVEVTEIPDWIADILARKAGFQNEQEVANLVARKLRGEK